MPERGHPASGVDGDPFPGRTIGCVVAGVYSHVVLDSVLYAAARPFDSLAWNLFRLEAVQISPVYGGFVLAGVCGVVGWLLVRRR